MASSTGEHRVKIEAQEAPAESGDPDADLQTAYELWYNESEALGALLLAPKFDWLDGLNQAMEQQRAYDEELRRQSGASLSVGESAPPLFQSWGNTVATQQDRGQGNIAGQPSLSDTGTLSSSNAVVGPSFKTEHSSSPVQTAPIGIPAALMSDGTLRALRASQASHHNSRRQGQLVSTPLASSSSQHYSGARTNSSSLVKKEFMGDLSVQATLGRALQSYFRVPTTGFQSFVMPNAPPQGVGPLHAPALSHTDYLSGQEGHRMPPTHMQTNSTMLPIGHDGLYVGAVSDKDGVFIRHPLLSHLVDGSCSELITVAVRSRVFGAILSTLGCSTPPTTSTLMCAHAPAWLAAASSGVHRLSEFSRNGKETLYMCGTSGCTRHLMEICTAAENAKWAEEFEKSSSYLDHRTIRKMMLAYNVFKWQRIMAPSSDGSPHSILFYRYSVLSAPDAERSISAVVSSLRLATMSAY